MSLFDSLVDEALRNQRELAPLRTVIEKELLHHDILRVLSGAGLLTNLTFIGGTCLRACYGSNRLSEDLDFTGGADFTRDQLATMGEVLVQGLKDKYGLHVDVVAPVRDEGNVDTWKLKVVTRPERRDIPAQRINIDVCAIPSYDRRPLMLRNHYEVEMGTSGLILQAQSCEEIFSDKLVAFALRPNRIKNRDLWDLGWLHQKGIKPSLNLVELKLADHRADTQNYLNAFTARVNSLTTDPKVVKDFQNEMNRFLPNYIVNETVLTHDFWIYLSGLLSSYLHEVSSALSGHKPSNPFKM